MLRSNKDDWVKRLQAGANKEWDRLKTFTLERYKITIKIKESLSRLTGVNPA